MTSPRAIPRSSLPATASGTNVHAYTWTDWGLLTAIALIWGSSFLFMEIGLRAFEPGVITLARVGLGAATLALFPRARAAVERDDRPRLAVLGVVWIAVPLTIFPVAQQWISSAVTGMINGAMPVFTVLWAMYLLRRLPGWRQTLGIGLGFVGMTVVFAPELEVGGDQLIGAALVVVAVAFYGLAANLAVPLSQKYGSLPVVFRAQLAALVIVVPLGLLQLPGSTWAWDAALAMVPLGVLGTGAAFVLMATLTGRVGGPRASVAIYFLPVVAIALGVLILGESVEPIAVAGVALVMAGAWIASRREA